jgi:D-beta-D-heptose 7-phosphate kinase/D-beta-D-heptose 1-phosphate adenosyltransferase
VIHAGHIALLQFAKHQGTKLVVGLDSDKRIKNSKGETRPINTLSDRIKVIEAIRYVDEVVSFHDSDSLIEQIKLSGAEIIVVGDDYADKDVIGQNLAKVVFFPRIENLSSTRIINEEKAVCF